MKLMNNYFIYRHAWRFNLSPDLEQELTPSQCGELLRHGGWMVRNTYAFDCREETDFWYVIKDQFGGMDELSSNERNKIRRSINALDIRLVDYGTIKEKAYPIIKATYEDHKSDDRLMNESVFEDYLMRCCQNKYDYWGIYDKKDGELVGFCAVHVWEDSCEYGMIGVKPQYRHNTSYPYYGLFYKMNEYYLAEKGFKYVLDGARSITEHSNIQPFLEQNFKFRKAYCKLKMRYQWWFGVVVRVLYPFRGVIPSRSVRAVLRMHSYQE